MSIPEFFSVQFNEKRFKIHISGFLSVITELLMIPSGTTKIQDLRAPIEKYLPGEAVSDARR